MRVTDITVITRDETAELSAMIDGYRLWYRMPQSFSAQASCRGDTFLVACLLPAMAKGETLEIDPAVTVCPRLLQATAKLQDIFVAWGESMRIPFKRIDIRANTSPTSAGRQLVGSFFSGGVDGTFTLLRHLDEVTHLIFVKGIDMQLTNDRLFDEVWKQNNAFADTICKPIVPVTTNVRFFCHDHGCGWPVYFGAGLASIAHALGLAKVFVASGMYFADLVPHGSHPLIDPLWSSESTIVEHDGADTRRIDKLRTIGRFEPALRILRVCWQDKAYNCGACEKCLRTMIQLRLLQIEAPTFPRLTDLRQVRTLDLWDDTEVHFARESLAMANNSVDIQLREALHSCLRRNELRRLLHLVDDLLLRGSIRRLRQWLKAKSRP